MHYYDAAQHAGDTGLALTDLVLAGPDPPMAAIEDARSRLTRAVDLRRPELVRSRVLSQIGLAKLMLASPAVALVVANNQTQAELTTTHT